MNNINLVSLKVRKGCAYQPNVSWIWDKILVIRTEFIVCSHFRIGHSEAEEWCIVKVGSPPLYHKTQVNHVVKARLLNCGLLRV
jgi:hypothetical protein